MEDLPEIINCSNLTRDDYLRLAMVRTVSAGACFSVTLVIFVAVVFIRAFGTLLQRLFVCLTAITAWHQANADRLHQALREYYGSCVYYLRIS